MRLWLCALALVCAAAPPTHAERKVAAFGLMGGINLASFYGEDVHDVSLRFWPVVGANLSFHLPKFLGLEIDALYASRGGAFKKPDTGGRNLVNTVKLHTFTIPVLLKITAPIGREAQPIFFIGPSVAIPISKGVTSESVGIDSLGQINSLPVIPAIIPTEELTDYDLLITVGAGMEWGLGCIQFRANISQAGLDKRKQNDVRTVTFEALAGFIF